MNKLELNFKKTPPIKFNKLKEVFLALETGINEAQHKY